MVEAVEKAGVPNMVWYNYRRVPAVTLAKQLIDEGRLGRIFHYRANFLQDWTISRRPAAGRRRRSGGSTSSAAGSGVTGDLLAHCIDTAIWLNGGIDDVTAMTETFVKERKHNLTGKVEPVGIDDACAVPRPLRQRLARHLRSRPATPAATRRSTRFEINGENASIAWDLHDLHRLAVLRPPRRGHAPRLAVDPRHRRRPSLHGATGGCRACRSATSTPSSIRSPTSSPGWMAARYPADLPRRAGDRPGDRRGAAIGTLPAMAGGVRQFLAIVAAAMLAATVAQAAPAKTLTFCSEGSPKYFNPMLGSTGTTFDANRPIYNRLVQFRPGTTFPARPGDRWDISADARSYTFHLRRNVAWQSNDEFRPSRLFDVDDVIFSFERQWKDANSFHTVSGGKYVYFGYMGMIDLLDRSTIDDHTVRFTLKHPYAPFLADLAMDFASIQSKEYADTLARLGRPEQIDQNPIGTGPFQFVSYQPETAIRYRHSNTIGGQAEDRHADLRHHQGRAGAHREAARRRLSNCRFSQLVRSRRDPVRSETAGAEPARTGCRLYRVQHDQEAVRRRAGADRAEHGD